MATTAATPARATDLHILREIALSAKWADNDARFHGLVEEAEQRNLDETQADAFGNAVCGDMLRTVHSYRPTTPEDKLQHRVVVLQLQLKREQRRGDRCAADLTQGELHGLRFALQALQQG